MSIFIFPSKKMRTKRKFMQTSAQTQNFVFGLIVSLYITLIVFYQDYEYSRLFYLFFLIMLYVCASILRSDSVAVLWEKYLTPNNLERKIPLTADQCGKDF